MRITTGTEYDCKLEVCDKSNIVTLTTYNRVIKSDMVKNFGFNSSETSDEQYQENKRKNVRKSANKIMKLVRYNAGAYKKSDGSCYPPIFLTLTFEGNVQDWDLANTDFTNFIKRLNYKVYGKKCSDLAYISVPELQQRGAIHYHILFFNLPYIDKAEVQKLWGLGRTRIEQERKFQDMNGESLGKYITKYMTKQFYSKDKEGNNKFYYTKELWEGKKVYFASRNLIKPQVFKFTKEELKSIDFIFTSPVATKVNTINIGEEEIFFSSESEYDMTIEKRKYIMAVASSFLNKYIKTEFFIGEGRRSVLDLGKNYCGWKYDDIDFSFGSFVPVGGEF